MIGDLPREKLPVIEPLAVAQKEFDLSDDDVLAESRLAILTIS